MSTERRRAEIRRSLRGMEDEANELFDFLENQRQRRKTIGIVINQGDAKHHITINTDDIPNDNSLIRVSSKGSVYSSGRCSPSYSTSSQRSALKWPPAPELEARDCRSRDDSVSEEEPDSQTRMWQAHRERRRRTKQTHTKPDQNNVSNMSKALTEVAEAITEEPPTQTPAARLSNIVSEAPPIPPRTVKKPMPLCPRPRNKIAYQQKPVNQIPDDNISPQEQSPPNCDEPASPVDSNDSEIILAKAIDEVHVENSSDDQQTDSDPDSGISGEATDLSQINFNLRDIDELDDLANDLFPVTLERPELSHNAQYHTCLDPPKLPALASCCSISQNAVNSKANLIYNLPVNNKSKVELEEQKATTDLSESTVKEIHEETAPEPEQSIQEIVEDSVPEAQQKEELIESENIGSVNNRLSRYQSKAQQSPEVKREPVPKSVSSIDHFKDNYLKQTEKTGSSVQSEMATAGALSLKDRMKMFESQSSKSVQREVVGQAERAGDIRSKISNWGSSEPSNSNNQRERITVAPLSERRSQYTAVANAN